MNKDTFLKELQLEYDRDFTGWDFSYLAGKIVEDTLPWNYRNIIQDHILNINNLVDMGTGGGEFLDSLDKLPKKTFATEAYIPNVKVASKRLSKKGIKIFQVDEAESKLPFADEEIELIINRHETYTESELFRILKKNGCFITQQVGGMNDININAIFEADYPKYYYWNLINSKEKLIDVGFECIDAKEYIGKSRFTSTKSIIYYLKCIPWQIPDFSIEKYEKKILSIEDEISNKGFIDFIFHRFLIIAKKPLLEK